SYASGTPVSSIIRAALPVTVSIVIGGAVLLVVTALLIGVGSALRPHTLFDRTLNGLIMCGVALHPLVVGLILQSVFVYTIPLATMLAIDVSTSLMAAFYIEAAFALPGIGTQALQAQVGFLGLDLPVIVGVVTVVATAVIISNVVADIIAAKADPRIVVARRT